MIVEHMMLGRAISNHDKIHIDRKPFSRAVQQYKNVEEKSFA